MFGIDFNKYMIYAIVIVGLIGSAVAGVAVWDHNIRQEALLEFNKKQLEQVVKDQQLFIQKMDDISLLSKQTLTTLQQKNQALDQQLSHLDEYLNSKEAIQNDRSLSPLLKNTFDQLGGQ